MKDGVNITSDEWERWAKFFGEQFPKMSKQDITGMTRRMIKTLNYCGVAKRMSRKEYRIRITNFKDSCIRADNK